MKRFHKENRKRCENREASMAEGIETFEIHFMGEILRHEFEFKT